MIGKLQVQKQGILGNQVLERYRVLLDYRNGTLYLKPVSKKVKTYQYDLSGISAVAGGALLREYYISQVAEGTPADLAGVRPGDRILRLNRMGAGMLSLGRIQKVLSSRAGRKVSLLLLREGQKIELTLVLRELI